MNTTLYYKRVELPEGEGALSQFPPYLEKSPNWVP